MSRGVGKTQRQILTVLAAGLSIGLSRDPRRAFRVLRELPVELADIRNANVVRSIHSLKRGGYVKFRKQGDKVVPVLTKRGRIEVAGYELHKLKVKPSVWDGIWRLIVFDIPEDYRWYRDAFRQRLMNIGFREMQRSVFVFPYPCENVLQNTLDVLQLHEYVRYIEADLVERDEDLRSYFNLGSEKSKEKRS